MDYDKVLRSESELALDLLLGRPAVLFLFPVQCVDFLMNLK